MGAVVGGLYASGMSAAQIEATMRSVDWQEAFRDAPPRRDLAFRRKQDDRNFLVRLPLGVQHRHILLPKGFIQGQKLQETLRQLTLPFSNTTNFDHLPTPFRAVATDLETGEAVLLDHGDLSIAMRASISAPGVFAPVDYQGRLLVDGGLAENLPIDVARAMGADILIVSDVSLSAAVARSTRFGAVDFQSDAGDPGAQGCGPAKGDAQIAGHSHSSPRSARRPPPISPPPPRMITQGEAAARAIEPRLAALRERRPGLSGVRGAPRGARARHVR